MSPYYVLGIPEGTPIDEARQAYRRLAMQHHPDRGGDAETFKRIQSAWELINSGKWVPPKPEPKPEPKPAQAQSSFYGGNPYAKPRNIKMPEVKGHGHNKTLHISISEQQAFLGCTVPFRYNRHIIDFEVRPGSRSHTSTYSFSTDPTIGAVGVEHFSVNLTLSVGDNEAEGKADMTLRVQLFAVSFIIGGAITVTGAAGEKVVVQIPEGHDPAKMLRVQGHGYGPSAARGDLILQFDPVFKSPSMLSENERKQVAKLHKAANP